MEDVRRRHDEEEEEDDEKSDSVVFLENKYTPPSHRVASRVIHSNHHSIRRLKTSVIVVLGARISKNERVVD